MDDLSPQESALRSYGGPWKGQLLLACSKCQRKLRRGKDEHGLGRLKKVLRKQAKSAREPVRLFVINTPCLKLCPKDGVTICTREQISGGVCSIVRNRDDLELLLGSYVAGKAPVRATLARDGRAASLKATVASTYVL